MNDQLRKQQIDALLRERSQYQRNLDAARKKGDESDVTKWTNRIQVVENSLRAYGHELTPQHKTAEKRGPGRPRKATKLPEQTEPVQVEDESS